MTRVAIQVIRVSMDRVIRQDLVTLVMDRMTQVLTLLSTMLADSQEVQMVVMDKHETSTLTTVSMVIITNGWAFRR